MNVDFNMWCWDMLSQELLIFLVVYSYGEARNRRKTRSNLNCHQFTTCIYFINMNKNWFSPIPSQVIFYKISLLSTTCGKLGRWRLQCSSHIKNIAESSGCTLIKFRRHNKASLGELVPLEILGKHQQGLTRGIWPRYTSVYTYYTLYFEQLVIPLGLSKVSTKC